MLIAAQSKAFLLNFSIDRLKGLYMFFRSLTPCRSPSGVGVKLGNAKTFNYLG